MGRLDELDLSKKIKGEEYESRLLAAQERLLQLRLQIGGLSDKGDELGPGVMVVMEGADAAGKGGAIKRMLARLDPRHYEVHGAAKPTFEEKSRHFLWRFWKEIPGLGGFTVFDRSWYGRVLVERVEGYATKTQWKRAYEEIVQFEKGLALEGIIVVKFYIQISPDEQLKRFKSREGDPLRRWKLTDEDWRNRKKLDQYTEAIEEMFDKTDHEHARWHVISGEQKKWARVAVLETLIAEIEKGIENFDNPVGDEDGWA